MTYKRVEYLAEGVTLYQGDCRDVFPEISHADAVIMDPPYELSDSGPGASHFGMSLKKFDSIQYKEILNGFDFSVFEEIEKICVPFNMFCFCSNKQISKIMAYHEERGRSVTLLVWHKTNAAPFANGVWRGDIEYVVHVRAKGATFVGGAIEKKKVFNHPIIQDDEHPTVKPISILEKYIRICSAEGGTILDPFAGSGSCGVAAIKLGRKFTGIEISPVYFDIACRRISDALSRPDMFVAPRVVPVKQETFI